jgi:hypothetical protein
VPAVVARWLVVSAALLAPIGAAAPDFALTVGNGAFRINGTPRFLVFVSYFDAMDSTSSNLHADFGALKKRGVDGVRILPDWWGKTSTESGNAYPTRTVISAAGSTANLAELRNVLDIARAEGLAVDLSFTAETLRACAKPPCAASSRPSSPLTTHQLATALAGIARDLAGHGAAYNHVLFDIQNEGNLWPAADGPLDAAAVSAIVTAVHAADSHRILTMSLDQSSSPAATAAFAEAAGLDVVTWHEDRVPAWWTRTTSRVAEIRAKTGKPIYLQEPEPAHNSSHWTLAGIKANLQAAKSSGAAAWCFHTHAGYYLDDGSSWFKHLTPDEAAFVDSLSQVLIKKSSSLRPPRSPRD